MAQIDLKLAQSFWGQGYATDALRTLIRHLFVRGFETIVVSPKTWPTRRLSSSIGVWASSKRTASSQKRQGKNISMGLIP